MKEAPLNAPALDPAETAPTLFRERAGRAATCQVFAPGRVNLIGEYTDFNDGFVLPLAIDRGVYAVARPRGDGRVRLWSPQMEGERPVEFPLSAAAERDAKHPWTNYIRGVLTGLAKAGARLAGFDALFHSTLPAGGGLSSSAALEIATATLVETLTGFPLDPVRKALLCQKAEHDFAGTPCGIMDQFAVTFGKRGRLLLLDCASLEWRTIPASGRGVSLLVINTMVRHALNDGGYKARRDDCFEAARRMGMPTLRHATTERVEEARERGILPERLYRRARHVATENERVLAVAAALERGATPDELGAPLYASHDSLRDDMEVSCRELDLVVEAAREIGPRGGVFGCRMTGGGFGGCCVALVDDARAEEVAGRIRDAYRRSTGISPVIFRTLPSDGAAALLKS